MGENFVYTFKSHLHSYMSIFISLMYTWLIYSLMNNKFFNMNASETSFSGKSVCEMQSSKRHHFGSKGRNRYRKKKQEAIEKEA